MNRINWNVLSYWALILALVTAFWAGVGLLAIEFARWIHG